jgi:cation transport regulator
MPYDSLKDLPKNVTNPLPGAAQRMWLAAFNSAYNRCSKEDGKDCETVARSIAWAAVKRKYKKGKDGKWVKKKSDE